LINAEDGKGDDDVPAVIPVDDDARVAALRRIGVFERTVSTPDFHALSRLAAFVTGAPFSAINLIDADRQIQLVSSDGQPADCPRHESLCQHPVYEGRTIHVADASLDSRFATSPYVTGERDRVALYCGVPLRDSQGYVLGTLCVTDSEPRQLSAAQLGALEDLARQVEQLFELRRQQAMLLDVLAEVDHLAVHDPLTGLVNRRMLADRLEQAINRAERGGCAPMVFFCDLDGFKAVNDTLGHQAGDEVLVHIAQRLRAVVRPADTVARVGGDEFLVLCEDLPPEHREALADRLRAAGEDPISTPTGAARVGVSVGMAEASPDRTVSDVLNEADRGMYLDKLARRGAA